MSFAGASNASTAWRIGSCEIWTSPPNPFSNSRIIPTAPATASAQSVRVTPDMKLRGANRPKLANSNVSQKTRRARNGFGVPWPSCWVNSHTCVADLGSKRHSLIQPPFVALICRFQGKHRILDLLEKSVCCGIAEKLPIPTAEGRQRSIQCS